MTAGAGQAPGGGPRGKLYLAGYGGTAPDAFFETLRPYGVDVALDIRIAPKGWSPSYTGPEFLRRLVEDGGARRARWARGLGNAGRFDGTGMRLADPGAVADLVSVLDRGLSVVVVCGCGAEEGCHRALVAAKVREIAPDAEIAGIPMPPRPPRAKGPKAEQTGPRAG
jgi:hypothetical protein